MLQSPSLRRIFWRCTNSVALAREKDREINTQITSPNDIVGTVIVSETTWPQEKSLGQLDHKNSLQDNLTTQRLQDNLITRTVSETTWLQEQSPRQLDHKNSLRDKLTIRIVSKMTTWPQEVSPRQLDHYKSQRLLVMWDGTIWLQEESPRLVIRRDGTTRPQEQFETTWPQEQSVFKIWSMRDGTTWPTTRTVSFRDWWSCEMAQLDHPC